MLAGGIPVVLAFVKRVGCSDAIVLEVDCCDPSENVEDLADMVDIEITGKVLTLSGRVNVLDPSTRDGDLDCSFRESVSNSKLTLCGPCVLFSFLYSSNWLSSVKTESPVPGGISRGTATLSGL